MPPPEPKLPAFFTYGIFKPEQLGYLRIKDRVENAELGTVSGELFERNGAALLDNEQSGTVGGYVLLLRSPENTYREIEKVEPEAQYTWEKLNIELKGEHEGESIGAKPLFSRIDCLLERRRHLCLSRVKVPCVDVAN